MILSTQELQAHVRGSTRMWDDPETLASPSLSLIYPSTCAKQHSAWGKMRTKEDFFPTFENFKEIVPSLVLMIPVSVQSMQEDLKSAD